jgi:hypothetical protein
MSASKSRVEFFMRKLKWLAAAAAAAAGSAAMVLQEAPEDLES